MSDAPSSEPDGSLNPYSAPSIALETPGSSAMAMGAVGYASVRSLAFWQLLFAIFLFVLTGLIALYFVFMFVMFTSFAGGSSATIAMFVGMGLLALVVIGIYVCPAILLMFAASAGRRFVASPNEETLHQMVRGQLRVWRAIGGLAIIMLLLWFITFMFRFI